MPDSKNLNPANIRLIKVNDEYQLLACLKHEIWGANRNRFGKWEKGEYLAFIVDNGIAALAKVNGGQFISKTPIWENGVFPFRIPIKFLRFLPPENRPSHREGEIIEAIRDEAGYLYGWVIMGQHKLSQNVSKIILNTLSAHPNQLPLIKREFSSYYRLAKNNRKI